jgi:hypothetical protein
MSWIVRGGDEVLAGKLAEIRPCLNEIQWPLLLGAEARTLGRGGTARVARAAGVSPDLVPALERLVDPQTRGDPEPPAVDGQSRRRAHRGRAPRRDQAAHHRRPRRLHRRPATALEGGAGQARRTDPAGHRGGAPAPAPVGGTKAEHRPRSAFKDGLDDVAGRGLVHGVVAGAGGDLDGLRGLCHIASTTAAR